jgi:hypothetical protein
MAEAEGVPLSDFTPWIGEPEAPRGEAEAVSFEDDAHAVAGIGWGPEKLDEMARIGMPDGALARFLSLEPRTRQLITRLLDSPSEQDWAELKAHPDAVDLAGWLLTLPAYVNARDDDEDDDEDEDEDDPPTL